MYFILCELWYFIFHVFKTSFLLIVHSCFLRVLYFFSRLSFGIWHAVEFTKGICNSFSGCDCLAFVVFHSRMNVFFPSRFYALCTFDASKFFQNLLFLSLSFLFFFPCCIFWSSCSYPSICVFSFRGVSPLLNESSDFIVSFTGLFIFVFLRPRHNVSSLCFFFGCCCV